MKYLFYMTIWSTGVFSRAAGADSSASIIAFEISPGQEAAFSARDGIASPFWSSWEDFDLPVHLLSVLRNGIDNSREGFSHIHDAAMACKYAYGDSGLYILLSVRDDSWGIDSLDSLCAAFEWLAWRDDAIELYFDPLHASRLLAKPYLHFTIPNTRLTKTMCMLQYRIGTVVPDSLFFFTVFNPGWGGGTGISLIGDESADRMFVRRARRVDGQSHAAVERIDRSRDLRLIEMRIPYGSIGTGIDRPRPHQEEEVACAIGYNDMDGSCYDGYDRLRWPREDPWSDSCQWGRLVFGPGIQDMGEAGLIVPGDFRAGRLEVPRIFSIHGTSLARGEPSDYFHPGVVIVMEQELPLPVTRIFARAGREEISRDGRL